MHPYTTISCRYMNTTTSRQDEMSYMYMLHSDTNGQVGFLGGIVKTITVPLELHWESTSLAIIYNLKQYTNFPLSVYNACT